MTHRHKYLFETMDALAKVHSLPFAYAENAHTSYQTPATFSSDWYCQDRPVFNWADIKKHLESPLFQQGVDRISALASEISAPVPVSRRRKPIQSDAGDELDQQRVWQGDLEHAWRATRREQSTGPSRVLILINAAASWNVSSQEMAIRGAAALALADALVSAGYTVQISAAVESKLTNTAKTRYSAEVVLLSASAMLDLHKLASLIASALLFRGVLMDHMTRVCPTALAPGVGYLEDLKSDTVDATGYDYVATIENGQLCNEYDAKQWLAATVAALQAR